MQRERQCAGCLTREQKFNGMIPEISTVPEVKVLERSAIFFLLTPSTLYSIGIPVVRLVKGKDQTGNFQKFVIPSERFVLLVGKTVADVYKDGLSSFIFSYRSPTT